MLTRFVRTQLAVFTIASIIGVLVMVFSYMQVPTLLGIGRITVTLELPATGGLYRFSNVTYRGLEIGTVTRISLTRDGANATLSLGNTPKVPADLDAKVLSVSAVGEQYVDLRPRTNSGPYLKDGAVIHADRTTIPQPIGPMLDQVSAMVGSIPKDKLSALLDETFKAFNGAGYDFQSLIDSGSTITRDANRIADRTRALVDDSGPFLDAQAQTTGATRQWAHNLAGVSEQLVINDPQLRSVLRDGPGAADEASLLLKQLKPTLPILLANLNSLGQVGLTYHASIEQLLVTLPPFVASLQADGPKHNPVGMASGDFAITVSDPPTCTVGFLPPSAWRSPDDVTDIDTPDGLYCKLPQDSPITVRGARNYPCMGQPGKRAPTVQICKSDQPYAPLAQTQHPIGPYPMDPNLIAQGIPPDSRAGPDSNIYGPIEGTPLPPNIAPPAAPDSAPAEINHAGGFVPPGPPAPADVPAPAGAPELPGPPPAPDDAVPAAPSAFNSNSSEPGPSVAVVQYDPRTGDYVSPSGQAFRQSDLVASAAPRTWKDLIFK